MRTELTELLPRYAFLAPLLRGARVLEIGALDRCGPAAAAALRERGAAAVVALGSPPAVERARREKAPAQVAFRSGPLARLEAGAFDLVLLHDDGPLLAEGGAAAVARLLAPGGRLAVATQSSGPSLVPGASAGGGRYGALLAALRPHFPAIEVATQQALLGWLMSPAGAAGLAVDGTCAAAEVPAFHLLLCGATASGLADQLLVPLPAAPVLATWAESGAGAVLEREKARVEQLVAELHHARERIAERESWIEGLRHEVEQREAQAEEQAAELRAAQVKLVKLEREHAEASESLRRVREQLVARSRELDGARRAVDSRTQDLRLVEEELDQVRGAAQSIQQERVALEAQLAEARAGIAALEAELAAARARIVELERELEAARQRNAALEGEIEAVRARHAGLEEELAAVRSQQAPRSPIAVVEEEQARLLAELEALRLRPPAVEEIADRAPAADDLSRRMRILEEQAEAAARRAREAEERMRAAERRADEAEAARAESVATARRWQLEAETARREAAGVAAGMADQAALRAERDEAIARAAEEAGRRAAVRAQLQEQLERANRAEAQVALLQRELDRLRGAARAGDERPDA